MSSYIAKYISAIVAPFQAMEDTLQQMLLSNIYTATGAAQDMIGRIVGQPRNGQNNDDYRLYQLARVAANRSKGTIEDLILVAKLLVNDPAAVIVVDVQGAAAVVVRVQGVIVSDSLANTILDFLSQTVSAGIHLILETIYTPDSDQWYFGLCAFPTGALTAGDTSIAVDSTAGFPSTGSLDLDTGLAVAETVTYGGITSNSFLGVSALAHNHATGSFAALHGSPGKGMGDTSDGTVGGEFESARDAVYP
jgi:hypothetical protein